MPDLKQLSHDDLRTAMDTGLAAAVELENRENDPVKLRERIAKLEGEGRVGSAELMQLKARLMRVVPARGLASMLPQAGQ